MRTKAKSEAAPPPPGEPWSEERRTDFVRGYCEGFWNVWEGDYPDFKIKLTPNESKKLGGYMRTVNGEPMWTNEKKCYRLLDKIVERIRKDHKKWERENRPERFEGKKQKNVMDWGAYTRYPKPVKNP